MSTPLTDDERNFTMVGSVRLSKPTWDRLRAYCKDTGRKQGFVTEMALLDYLDERHPQFKKGE